MEAKLGVEVSAMFMTWLLALLLTVAVLVLIGLARVLGKDVPEVPSRPHGQDDAQAGHLDEDRKSVV